MSELRDFNHPYYCSESNFYSRDAGGRFDTWAEFKESLFYDGDRDMNLLFRWDWWQGSDDTPDMVELFFVLQRKGIFAPVQIVEVFAEDEPEIRAWLEECWQTITATWAPISAEGTS